MYRYRSPAGGIQIGTAAKGCKQCANGTVAAA